MTAGIMKVMTAAAILMLMVFSTAQARHPIFLGTGAEGALVATGDANQQPGATHSAPARRSLHGAVTYPPPKTPTILPESTSSSSYSTTSQRSSGCASGYADEEGCDDGAAEAAGTVIGITLIIIILVSICMCCVPCIVAGIVMCYILDARKKRNEADRLPPPPPPMHVMAYAPGHAAAPYPPAPAAPIGVAAGGPPPQWGPAPQQPPPAVKP